MSTTTLTPTAITDAQLWDALDVPATTCAELNAWHLAEKETFWQLIREEAQATAKMTARELHGHIDALNADPETNDLEIVHSVMNALDDVALQVVKTGHAGGRQFLLNGLRAAWRNAEGLQTCGKVYPLYGMLGAHHQYRSAWFAYQALLHSGPVPEDVTLAAMKLLLGQGLEMYRVTGRYMVHNIFTAANYGLFYVARTLPEFRDAAAWEAQALGNLNTDFDRSFYADGGHLERNWWYGYYTVRRLTNTWKFAQRTGGLGAYAEHIHAGLRRAYKFYAYTLDASGLPPSFGDEGGLKNLEQVLDEAVSEGVFPLDTPHDLGVDRTVSYLMDGAGVAIMRNGGRPEDVYANISFGEYAGWHSHHDLLSLNFRALGEVLVEEALRFGPYEHPMDILWRGPEAHNQLVVDTFHYDCRPIVGQDVHWHSDAMVDYFSAYHTAYRQQPPDEHRVFQNSSDLIVRRTLVFVKDPGYLLVLDSVRQEGRETFNRATSLWWHGPQPFRPLGDGLARTAGRKACLLAWAYPETIRRVETGDDFLPEEITEHHKPPISDSWHSLRLRSWIDQPYSGCLGFATVLYPFVTYPPAVHIRPLGLPGSVRYRAEGFEVITPAGRDRIILNPERLPDFASGVRAEIALGKGRGKVVVE